MFRYFSIGYIYIYTYSIAPTPVIKHKKYTIMNINIDDILLFFWLFVAISIIVIMNTTYMKYTPMDNNIMTNTINDNDNDDIGEKSKYDISNTTSKAENFENFNVAKDDISGNAKEDGIQSTIIETNFNRPMLFLGQGYYSTPLDRNMVNRDDAIKNPDHNDILRYDGSGCYTNLKNIEGDQQRRVQMIHKPENKTQKCKDRLKIASVNTVRTKVLTSNGDVIHQYVNFYIPQTYLEGTKRGMQSIDAFAKDHGEPADIDQIGSIPVNNYKGEPVPIGSNIFN